MKHLALLILLASLLFRPSAYSSPPNLILILADDLGWADLGCYGNTFNETPHLDRFARDGMRFTQFYAGPVCSPTRCNLQSGQDQARFGITQHIPGHQRPFARLADPAVPRQMPLEVETFAECLAKAGYATGYFGKWHLGGAGFGPADQGWQTALECNGNTQPPKVTGSAKTLRTTDFLAQKAEEFIAANRDRPFVLQISHAAVHIPLSTTPELKAKYENKTPMPGYPSNPQYAGLTEELDQSVGRVVAAVDRAGIAENTLIVFLSDNGGLEHEQSGRVVTSNQPLRGEKGTLYEGGIRVPGIARWTGKVPAGTQCDTPLITMDLHPTFLELASAATPKSQPCDGASLAAVLRDPAATLARDTLHWHLPHYHHSTPASALRRGDWKLLEFFEDGTLELYDLKNDPGEQRNLASAQPTLVQELLAALQAWHKDVKALMPVPNPRYDPVKADQLGKGLQGGRKKRPKQ
ncbi:MAG: sulfatase [Verrucomicrobia bacterium]|nr:sulfatase [Verrucomicrobiota bacterium]MDA1006201.1 sulfatase [Verrucomicrobiota bacterium]